ncbi:MAG: hypothetical protein ACKOWL_07985 [Sphingobacteriaceae bacterium]
MKKGVQIFVSILIIAAFTVVITSDFWKSPTSTTVVSEDFGSEKDTNLDGLNDLKEQMKEKFFTQFKFSLICQQVAIHKFYQYLLILPSPNLVVPQQPPELA